MDIFENVNVKRQEFKDALQELTITAKTFTDEYKAYCMLTMRDSDLLRERLVNKVAEILNDADK